MLLRDHFAGTAELLREVLELRQAVPHTQDRLGVVDVDRRLEVERRDRRRVDVDEAERRMIRHDMAATLLAVLPLAERRLLVGRDVLGAGRDLDRLRLPQAEGVHRAGGPRPARPAMAIAHRLRRSRDLQFYGAAEAAS